MIKADLLNFKVLACRDGVDYCDARNYGVSKRVLTMVSTRISTRDRSVTSTLTNTVTNTVTSAATGQAEPPRK